MNPVTEPGWLSGQTCLFYGHPGYCSYGKVQPVGPLQLAIHVVQSRRAGEQKSHWDKTNKGNYHLKLRVFCWSCPSATFVLRHGGFVPREWLAANSLSLRWLRLGIPGAASFVLRPGIILFLAVTHSALLEYHESTSPRPQ